MGSCRPTIRRRDRRRRTRITADGAVELDVWLHTPDTDESPPRDALVMKMLIALRLPGIDVPALLQSHRRQLVESMQWYTHLKSESDHDIGLTMLADAELFRLEAVIRWLDTVDARIRQMTTPLPLATPAAVGPSRKRAGARR